MLPTTIADVAGKLADNRRRQHGNDLFVGFVNQFQDIDHLRTLDDGAERAGLQAFAAGDAGFVIDMFLAELILW